MGKLCPVCNGLQLLTTTCRQCKHGTLYDEGPVHNYVGPYAPYEVTAAREAASPSVCNHLAICDSCGHYSYIVVKNDII